MLNFEGSNGKYLQEMAKQYPSKKAALAEVIALYFP